MQESLSEVGDRKGLMGCGPLVEYPHPEGSWAITVKGLGLGWGAGPIRVSGSQGGSSSWKEVRAERGVVSKACGRA